MLESILNQAFEQYVFDRVDNLLSIAGVANAKYAKAMKESESILLQLMAIAREQEAQYPELLPLVMKFETVTVFESSLAAEIAYRAGIRDRCSVRQEFVTFIQKNVDIMQDYPCSPNSHLAANK
ncbi:Hypothetical protein LUCI_1337 [Lucifera butyrica]|uniref:Uncharacterized protein n=1 Tax=Lucifera butyrica TaxID=1351585 RepID=A0A498R775_9FIRM|nr:hypothetical protein [Lucifera butyrica]VBB06122.1 Hypothetical protein LUCI_1337 [Lucifera butyrica]